MARSIALGRARGENDRMLRLIARFPALVLPVLMAGCMTSAFQPVPREVVREKNVVFTPDGWPESLEADVYHRTDGSRVPAVLLVHGGAWKAGGPRWSMSPIAWALAKRGYAVVNASYRGTPDFSYPAPLVDLTEAVDWTRRNADRYGIDPERIAVFGYSAGGHLAEMLALKDGNPLGIRAVVAGGAPSDFTTFPADKPVPAFLGGPPETINERFLDISPVLDVTPSSPPVFLYHGTRDSIVDPDQTHRMEMAYRRSGLDPEVRWLDGRGHFGAYLFPGGTIEEAIDFLDAHLRDD